MIKDSGARRQFFGKDGEKLAVRDIQEGKGRCDLLPLRVVAEWYKSNYNTDVANVLFKIADYQESGDETELLKCLGEFMRGGYFATVADMLLELSKHFEDGAKKYGECNWQKGIPTHCYIDSAVRHYLKFLRCDDDERHDRAFVWNIMCCIWTCENKPELNDYAKK